MTQRNNIIHYTSKMFVEQGIKAVRMDDIAKELSISKRTLYELFGDKEELIYHSIKHYLEQSRERRIRQVINLENPLEIMVVCIRDMIDGAPVAGRIRRNMRRFYPSVYAKLEEEIQDASQNDLRRWMSECLECGYFDKRIRAEYAIKLIHHSVHGVLVNTLDEETPSNELISLMSYSLLVFIRGLCTIDGQSIIDDCTQKYFSV